MNNDNYECAKRYIESFELEEGGPLTMVQEVAVAREIYWGTWYGRKLLYISWKRSEPIADVGFSLDFAQYEVAAFCKFLDDAIGMWQPSNDLFMAIGSVAEGNQKILWNTDAMIYRTMRDSGRIGDDTNMLN